MAKKYKKKKKKISPHIRQIIIGGVFIFIGILVIFKDSGGIINTYMSILLEKILGRDFTLIFSPIIIGMGTALIVRIIDFDAQRLTGLLLYFICIPTIIGTFSYSPDTINAYQIGFFDLSRISGNFVGNIPSFFLFFSLLIFALWMIFEIPYVNIMYFLFDFLRGDPELKKQKKKAKKERVKKLEKQKVVTNYKKQNETLEQKIEKLEKAHQTLKQKSSVSKKINISPSFSKKKEEKKKIRKNILFDSWDYPTSSLLNKKKSSQPVSAREVALNSMQIESTLSQFKIDVTMQDSEHRIGPTVIQYHLKPREGIKLSRIENLKKDLALSLMAKSIRIQAPIPGKDVVGIEVPNSKRQIVQIRELIESPEFVNHASNLAMVIGKNIGGESVICDLKTMPHLLIAGQTGSGKSVGMNGFLVSLLYKNSPSELRIIMIDPKRVELGIYNGIPHLLTPVINNPEKALNSLKWCIAEMMRRYDIFTQVRCRNLSEYNAKAGKKDRLPNIVIVIDELADLMMSGNKKDVENAIARIAQMARAVGMHLIVATQRPSVDIITGLIKANIPSRIAFTVASQIDSRTILDRVGAEDLLGRWDMLYNPSGASAPDRVQGVFVTTAEVESIIHHVKRTIDPNMLEDVYDDTITQGETVEFGNGETISAEAVGEDKKIIKEAINLIRSNGKASTSMLQRHLKLGYARAARVMDTLEEMGVVGPAQWSKPREIL